MGRQRPHGGIITAALVVICLALAVGGFVLVAPGRAGELVGITGAAWHPGRPTRPAPPVLVAAGSTAPAPTADRVAATLEPLLRDPALGGRTLASVIDVTSGDRLYDRNADTAAMPASTVKLFTAMAALAARGPAYRIETKVVAGATPGEVVLVGGGDPTLTAREGGTYAGAARFDQLAAQVKQALGGSTAPTRVVIDTSLFTGPTTAPGWDDDIATTSGFGAHISALTKDGARTRPDPPHGFSPRSAQPDLAAGQAFATALGLAASSVTRGTAPPGATQLGVVQSPPLVRLVEYMLGESDNVIAECLARQVALARNQPASFAGGTAAVTAVLGELGLALDGVTLIDGSGLSRNNRLTPKVLTDALALAAKSTRTELRVVYTGLSVAAYSGTLRDRYRKQTTGGTAAGLVRAKTGTLTGISAIAGFVVDADGRMLVFAVIADAVPGNPFPAQDALDRVAAALAACGCR